jgi:hypothetical protein
VRPARAAALARPPPPRAPHVESCVPARRLRRDLQDTQVSGDVSGWAAMTKATVMCVPRAPLRSIARPPLPRAPHVQSCVPAHRLRRYLGYTSVSGDVSGWSALTQTTNMCVPRAPLRSPAHRRRVHLTWRAASPPVGCAETFTVPRSAAMSRAGRQ